MPNPRLKARGSFMKAVAKKRGVKPEGRIGVGSSMAAAQEKLKGKRMGFGGMVARFKGRMKQVPFSRARKAGR